MKAVIMAGGKGTRLSPYTTVLPKPLMPLGERPILEILISQLRHFGIKEIVITVGYLAELIEAYFGDGSKFGVQIVYSREDKPLGTAGPLGLVEGLTEPFLVMNGDLLTNLDYRKLLHTHLEDGAACTIGMCLRDVEISLGVLEVDDSNRLLGYCEKPTYQYRVSMGVYVLAPSVLQIIEKERYLDFPDLVQLLLRRDEKVVGFPFDGYWLDIGRHDDYAVATDDFQRMRTELMYDN
jgi:NDP-sugar pyrophosphorylase family protein